VCAVQRAASRAANELARHSPVAGATLSRYSPFWGSDHFPLIKFRSTSTFSAALFSLLDSAAVGDVAEVDDELEAADDDEVDEEAAGELGGACAATGAGFSSFTPAPAPAAAAAAGAAGDLAGVAAAAGFPDGVDGAAAFVLPLFDGFFTGEPGISPQRTRNRGNKEPQFG
jgi:hypothetical protein